MNHYCPPHIPKTVADLYRIACSIPGGTELLESFAKHGSSPFYFLIGAESGNGPCLAAVRAHKPLSTDVRGKRRDRVNNGFRPGKVPLTIAYAAPFFHPTRMPAEWRSNA